MADDETPRSSRIIAARTILEFGYRADDRDVEEHLQALQRTFDEIQAVLMVRADGHGVRT
ncbi:MAG: hypothetical protein ACREQY_23290 [Candidatus Binatia bacterium]